MPEQAFSNKVYSLFYRRLHWALATIIITLLVAGQQFNLDLSETHRIYGLKAHSSLGTIALLVALLLIVKRFVLRKPTPKPQLALLKRVVARTVQFSLYLLAVVIPVSGIACALYSEYPVYLFGVFDIGGLQVSSEQSYAYLNEVHLLATRLAMLLLACHAGAALYHHFIVKDGVLKSMAAADPLLTRWWQAITASKRKAKDMT